jgi:hypothetical protein
MSNVSSIIPVFKKYAKVYSYMLNTSLILGGSLITHIIIFIPPVSASSI